LKVLSILHIFWGLGNEKILNINIFCGSNLPDWKKTDYSKSYSASKKLGGGVLLDLSHEIDYLHWIFGDLNILYSYNKKISNLDIDCDDFLSLNAQTKKIYLLI
jgi:CMP-N,N'-diacetyllegionaminic acid synthase